MRRLAALAAAGLFAVTAVGGCGKADEDPLAGATTTTSRTDSAPRHVALGDSFTAGGGAPPYRDDGANCVRSDRSWVFLLDDDPVDLLACGGATISTLLDGTDDGLRASQLPASPRPEVDRVLVTVGLNDVAFLPFVWTCVTTECTPSTSEERAQADAFLGAVRTDLVDDLYPRIRSSFPNARVVHVGYPHLFPAAQSDVTTCPWLSGAERTFLRDFVDAFHRTVRGAIAEANDDELEFLAATEALQGRELCTPASEVIPLDTPDGSGGHLTAAGYATFASFVRARL